MSTPFCSSTAETTSFTSFSWKIWEPKLCSRRAICDTTWKRTWWTLWLPMSVEPMSVTVSMMPVKTWGVPSSPSWNESAAPVPTTSAGSTGSASWQVTTATEGRPRRCSSRKATTACAWKASVPKEAERVRVAIVVLSCPG
ncbi:MAG: hypothetical protein QM820_05470 [Minicystis sp.]